MDATTSTLPQEMIYEEILPRLDVKSLLKFRCVSKSWRSLIDSKQFIKTHHQNSMKHQSFPHQRVIIQRFNSWPDQSPLLPNASNLYPFLLENPTSIPLGTFEVVGCCNGLVCILEYPATFHIWNPSTSSTKKLPEVSRGAFAGNCGFGWVESSGEYKVFATFYDAYSKEVGSKLYSSNTKSWKATATMDHIPGELGMFVGEKLHYRMRGDVIVFFDLKSEVFGRIEMPGQVAGWNGCNKWFGVLGGCICMVLQNSNRREVLGVWVVKEYGAKDCWERVVSRDGVVELLRQPGSAPFMVGRNGKIVVLFRNAFLVYYPRDNVFRFLPKCEYDGYIPCSLCIESLESP